MVDEVSRTLVDLEAPKDLNRDTGFLHTFVHAFREYGTAKDCYKKEADKLGVSPSRYRHIVSELAREIDINIPPWR